jgi:AraC-like DNA-binding protein
METLFSTNDVHPRDRFDYWHQIACCKVVNHDSRPECRATFHATLQADLLADIGLVLFENAPMTVTRTRRQVARAMDDHLFVCRQVSGKLALEQGGREVVLEPGDMTLLDPLLPYAGRFFSGSRLLALKIPRRALEARIGSGPEMLLHPITPVQAEGSLTSSFVAMLPAHAGRMRPEGQQIVKEQVLDLIAVSLAKASAERKPRLSGAHALAVMKIRAAIEARLTDPSSDADTLAAAAGISVRYANAVLAREGTSIMRLLLERRLARCRGALKDPLHAHRTLTEIAFGWGFSDMTHFGRTFKAAYGVLPSEYRRVSNHD